MKTNYEFDLNLLRSWRQDLLPEELGCQLKDLQRKAPSVEHSGIAGLGRSIPKIQFTHGNDCAVPRYSRPNGYPDPVMEDWRQSN